MRHLRDAFVVLYTIGPLILVPYFAFRFGNWSLLFGIPISYLATVCAPAKASPFYLALLFCIGFWVVQGFSIHHYVTFFFLCAAWGHVTWMFADAYDQESKRGTIENDAERAKFFDQNREAIEAQLLEHIKRNPGKQVTLDDVDAIVRATAKRSGQ
jgi:hypothetical protein